MYLDIGVYEQIQGQFEEESQVELPDFLLVRIKHVSTVSSRCVWLYTSLVIRLTFSA